MNITVIDNYDSFVYNLVDYMERNKKVSTKVYRNNRVSVNQVLNSGPDAIVLSPGPGRPEKAGICVELIKQKPPELPLLGVCLGHQAAGFAFKAAVKKAANIFHGKTSLISHDGRGVFKSLKNPFKATRYHSLVLDKNTIPSEIQITAESDDGEVMGIRYEEKMIFGVQFHPESILTEGGLKIVNNFLNIAEKTKK